MFQVSEFINIRERVIALGCSPPQRVAILPRNFATAHGQDELLHEATTSTVRKLLRQVGIEEEKIEPEGIVFPSVSNKSADWLLPPIFIGASLLSENPHLVDLAIGVIS